MNNKKYYFLPTLAICVSLGLAACSSTPHEPSSISVSMNESRMNELALYALSLADTPYRYGGNHREQGFDCSGFVKFVYEHSLGMQLPRTSLALSRVGQWIASAELRPGDLVFFNTSQRDFSHVGIYVGEGRFVHAPSSGKAISVSRMSDQYWHKRYNGGRRMY